MSRVPLEILSYDDLRRALRDAVTCEESANRAVIASRSSGVVELVQMSETLVMLASQHRSGIERELKRRAEHDGHP